MYRRRHFTWGIMPWELRMEPEVQAAMPKLKCLSQECPPCIGYTHLCTTKGEGYHEPKHMKIVRHSRKGVLLHLLLQSAGEGWEILRLLTLEWEGS
jgi:hypothetical protein